MNGYSKGMCGILWIDFYGLKVDVNEVFSHSNFLSFVQMKWENKYCIGQFHVFS